MPRLGGWLNQVSLVLSNFVKTQQPLQFFPLIHSFKQNICEVIRLQVFLRRFRDPIRVPRIRENYHRVLAGPYRVPNIFLKKNPDYWQNILGSHNH